MTDEKGVTQREHLEQVERQLGFKPDELVEPCVFPKPLTYIWVAFCRLSQRRSEGGPITFTEIKAWQELYGVETKPWEIEVIIKLDETFLKVNREK